MRVGVSWDFDGASAEPGRSWRSVVSEAVMADSLGLDSVWIRHEPDVPGGVPAPNVFLTYLAEKTQRIALHIAGRRVDTGLFVHVPEEVAVLDTFSGGRAGLSFASPNRQGVPAGHVQEVVDFTHHAWHRNEFRFRGDYIRFPSHTPDEAPKGASYSGPRPYVPQWEWGEITPDFLAVTPRPVQPQPPVTVELDHDITPWVASRGLGAFVSADHTLDEAHKLLQTYHQTADEVSVPPWRRDVVIESAMTLDGEGPGISGTPDEVVQQIRDLAAETRVTHLVWRRDHARVGQVADLFTLASQIQPLLQA